VYRQEGSLKEEIFQSMTAAYPKEKTGMFSKEVKVHVTNILNTARI